MSYVVLWDRLNDELVKLNVHGTPVMEVVALYPSLQAAEDMKAWALQNGNENAERASDWTPILIGSNPFEEKQETCKYDDEYRLSIRATGLQQILEADE